MSRKKLITDNLIILVGGNIGNVFSFLTNFILLALPDKKLANLYVAYNSVVLILGVPALVAMRMFTLYGDTILYKLKSLSNKAYNILTLIILLGLLALIPIGYLITISTQDGNIVTTSMIIILSFVTFVVYCFRGLRQFEEDFIAPVISLNVETLGRTLLVLLFGVYFGWGIYGVFFGAILSMAFAILPCFKLTYISNPKHSTDDYRLKTAFLSSFILTAGTEFFSNFDVAYSLRVLSDSLQDQTEYNVLQIFRKIIFYGLFFTAGLFLSLGSKGKYSKKFTFYYTVGVSLFLGLSGSLVCYLLKDIFLQLLNNEFIVLDDSQVLYFLIFTAFMSASYILSNWLLAQKKKKYIYIPVIASIVQVFVFVTFGNDIDNLIKSFSISSLFYFIISVIAGIYEVHFSNAKS
jgi:hypothetical protein